MPARETTTRTARHWLGDDGILRTVHLNDEEHTLADAEENVRAVASLVSGGRAPLLVDTRQRRRSISREARMYYAGPESAQATLAMAILVSSPVSRAVANFFISIARPRFPTRLFTGEAEAVAWLRSFLS